MLKTPNNNPIRKEVPSKIESRPYQAPFAMLIIANWTLTVARVLSAVLTLTSFWPYTSHLPFPPPSLYTKRKVHYVDCGAHLIA